MGREGALCEKDGASLRGYESASHAHAGKHCTWFGLCATCVAGTFTIVPVSLCSLTCSLTLLLTADVLINSTWKKQAVYIRTWVHLNWTEY